MQNIDLVEITKNYYDSTEADEFYHEVWGGEDIHIGIYENSNQTIKEASRNTVVSMIQKLPNIKKDSKILDLGSGYGGAARLLAQEFGCRVDCLNLSEIENNRNRAKTKAAGQDNLVSVTSGNFEQIPFDNSSYDVVWSQDALLHSNKKQKVFEEVARVLKPGGYFIFTDPMQSDDCHKSVLKDVLARIHLEEMGSVKRYKNLAKEMSLQLVQSQPMPKQLINHYSKVLEILKEQFEEVAKKSNKAYLEKMMIGLQHWIDAGTKGYLNWGILQFQKPLDND